MISGKMIVFPVFVCILENNLKIFYSVWSNVKWKKKNSETANPPPQSTANHHRKTHKPNKPTNPPSQQTLHHNKPTNPPWKHFSECNQTHKSPNKKNQTKMKNKKWKEIADRQKPLENHRNNPSPTSKSPPRPTWNKAPNNNPWPTGTETHNLDPPQTRYPPEIKPMTHLWRSIRFMPKGGGAASIRSSCFIFLGRLRSGAAASIWGGFSSPTAPPSTTSSGPDLGW